jgi:serine phosphatase RsbU (regulator of sigma subunit)
MVSTGPLVDFKLRPIPFSEIPALATLECAGICVQAREVGGDYYDFLNFGQGRLGLVVGDISGKGIAAALLMANLQANLRSQFAVALEDPCHFMPLVNRLFYESTADHHYATLFFAIYEDNVKRLRYANCGHMPALLLRNDGKIERLDATGTVVGLFEEWDCGIEERTLASGDTLLLYTDGVTEASNDAGEEFGEQRLAETLLRNRALSAQAVMEKLVEEIRRFSSVEQADDLTLIVAKLRTSSTV